MQMLEQDLTNNHGFSIRKQCLLLGLNRSNLYYQKSDKSLLDQDLANKIYDIWLKYPFFGYRKIKAILEQDDIVVNHKKIKRLMQIMNIAAIVPRKKINLSNIAKNSRKFPYLLKGIVINKANQIWTTDITYIKMIEGGFVYFVAIIDLYSRFITASYLSTNLEAEFCVKTLKLALKKYQKPEIFNTDQGSQFTSNYWLETLINNNIQISMDGKGRCFDNIFSERLWRTIKYEEVYLKSYDSVDEARKNLKKFVNFYNYKRPHQSLNYKTPAEIFHAGNNDKKNSKLNF